MRYIPASSHAPFNRQPPYLENWSEIRYGRLHRHLQSIDFAVVCPDLSHAGDAYLRSIPYDFTVPRNYLLRFLREKALIIILGDHQPNAQLTGPDAPWNVPVHVLSRCVSLLEGFLAYTTGDDCVCGCPRRAHGAFSGGFPGSFQQCTLMGPFLR